MTGLDCLKSELRDRGCTPQQISTKVVAVILDIVANSGDKYTRAWEDEDELRKDAERYRDEIRRLEREQKELAFNIRRAEEGLSVTRRAIAAGQKDLENKAAELDFFWEKCTTDEAKDAISKAALFREMTRIDTKYDNTAFIVGLGAILSEGKYSPEKETEKFNPKLFQKKKEEET